MIKTCVLFDANEAMLELFEDAHTNGLKICEMHDLVSCIARFMKNVKKEGECILNTVDNLDFRKATIDEYKKSFGDLTAVECEANELYYPLSKDEAPFAVRVLSAFLAEELLSQFPKVSFYIFISVNADNDDVILNAWFHVLRYGERYFDNCLDNYAQPVMSIRIVCQGDGPADTVDRY